MTDFFAEMENEIKQEAERVLTDTNQNQEFLKNFLKLPPEEGEITIRLLPPAFGMTLPYQATRLHKLNGRSFHCRHDLEKGKWSGPVGQCPACDYYRYLWKQAEIAGEGTAEYNRLVAAARAIKPMERYYYLCVVRDDPSQKGYKIYSTGKSAHKIIVRALVGDPKIKRIKKLGNIFDPVGTTGRDFVIVKELTGRPGAKDSYPSYDASTFLDPSPLGDDEMIAKWANGNFDPEALNISELRKLKTADELKHQLKVHLGVAAETASGFDPSEYGIVSGGAAVTPSGPETPVVETPVVETPVIETPVVETPVEVPTETPDDILADDEFMNIIDDLNIE
jgi:hypothetical protein